MQNIVQEQGDSLCFFLLQKNLAAALSHGWPSGFRGPWLNTEWSSSKRHPVGQWAI